MSAKPLILGAVGDIFINRADGASAFIHVQEALDAADILFANSEGVYTDSTEVAPSSGIPVVSPARNLPHLQRAGVDIWALANNHALDAGHAAFLENLDGLRNQGALTVGAGVNAAAARKPALLDRSGARIAFLAYTMVYRPGYEARLNVPGVAALRVHTQYFYPDWDPVGILEPGSMPHVRTFCYPEDVTLLQEAVAAAKAEADIVVVSFHCGDSTRPAFLHDYEHAYPHAAIDAGADIILSHHHHFLRGCSFYRDKPIFHGLGHFAFDLVGMESTIGDAVLDMMRTMPYGIFPREGYPLLPFHPECRMTVIAYCFIETGRVAKPCLLPCVINPANQPVPFSADADEGVRVSQYIRTISRDAGLATTFSPTGPTVAGFRTLAMSMPSTGA